MPTEKPKILFVADEELIERIEDFRFDNRINSRSEAIRILIEAGLKAKPKTPKKKKGIEIGLKKIENSNSSLQKIIGELEDINKNLKSS